MASIRSTDRQAKNKSFRPHAATDAMLPLLIGSNRRPRVFSAMRTRPPVIVALRTAIGTLDKIHNAHQTRTLNNGFGKFHEPIIGPFSIVRLFFFETFSFGLRLQAWMMHLAEPPRRNFSISRKTIHNPAFVRWRVNFWSCEPLCIRFT